MSISNRDIATEWIFDVCVENIANYEQTYHTALELFDRFFGNYEGVISLQKLQLVATTVMFIASKYCDVFVLES